MNSVEFIQNFKLFSREGKRNPDGTLRHASKAEIKRWLDANAVKVNGERMKQEEIDFPIFSLVLFPKGQKVTLK